jgi:hypothetical protein
MAGWRQKRNISADDAKVPLRQVGSGDAAPQRAV